MNYKKKTMKLLYERFDAQKEKIQKNAFFALSVHDVISKIGLVFDNVNDILSWEVLYCAVVRMLQLDEEEIKCDYFNVVDYKYVFFEDQINVNMNLEKMIEEAVIIIFKECTPAVWEIPLLLIRNYGGGNLYFKLDSNRRIMCVYTLKEL